MTQTFAVGDRVILDRVAEIEKYGTCAPRFDRALYRAIGTVMSLAPWRVEWRSITDGVSRGRHGAGIGADYLIRADRVERDNDGFAESTASFAHRLSKVRGKVQRALTPLDHSEAERTAPEQPQTPSGVILHTGRRAGKRASQQAPQERELMSADSAGRGAALAHGDRQKAYGHPKVSFDRIAAFWETYLEGLAVQQGGSSSEIPVLTGEDVGHMMNLLKVSRSITDKGDDTLDDLEGYVTCIRMIRQAKVKAD